MNNRFRIRVETLKEWYEDYFYVNCHMVDDIMKAKYLNNDYQIAQILQINWEQYLNGVKKNNGIIMDNYCYFNTIDDCKNFINTTLNQDLLIKDLIEA